MRTLVALLIVTSAALADDGPHAPKKKVELPPLGAPAGAFGAPIDPQVERVALEKLLADPDAFAGKTIAVEAPIADVCRTKGCWMVLKAGEKSMRVKFKDYAFFVPRDASGRRVLIQGVCKTGTISEADARHYAAESGDPEKAKEIHGPQQVVAFIATGAEVLGAFELPKEVKVEATDALVKQLQETDDEKAKSWEAVAPEGLLRRLRETPGARTREFAATARIGIFQLFGDEGFGRGFAVHAGSLRVIELGGAK